MSITEKMRKVFDACAVMAGVEPDFECVYMTKGVALLYLDEIDAENERLKAENAKLRERVDAAHMSRLLTENENESLRELVGELWEQAEQNLVCDENCPYGATCDWRDCVFKRRMRELGVEVDA